ncbi:MAG: hypothetical protein JJE04_22125 [Acidobacteriia bacterium]|nr:hypothetical protein [Terriglobia bacterium]
MEIMRGLTAEYATVKAFLPRSKKHLPFPSDGKYDKAAWNEAGREYGPAARVGDLIQITKVDVESEEIKLEINGGLKTGRKWYERIEMGTGNRTTPINNGGTPTAGTYISVLFPKGVPPIEAKEIKKLLAPILDFDKHSATENYVESLPEPIQAAIRDKRAVEGMNREQVLIACGRPRNKMRETKDGDDLEEWIYGLPPGKITFVVFQGDKVIRVKDAYAGLGGSTADPLPPR